MSQDRGYWIDEFVKAGALWIHNGDRKAPHALLTSGNHSNGFFNASLIITNPKLLQEACGVLIEKTQLPHPFPGMVFGSAMGAVNIAYEMACQASCKYGFTEPFIMGEGSFAEKIMVNKRFSFAGGTRIFVVEDVMTTGGTTQLTMADLILRDADIFPKIAVLVNRSGNAYLDGRNIVALIDHKMPIWEPGKCPLCREGSKALRPKENWKELVAGSQ